MKTSISNALQIVSAIVLTGSVAYAMAAPAPTTQFNAESTAQTQTEQTEIAPVAPTEPAQQPSVPEQPVTQPEPETPSEPAPTTPSNRIPADLSAGQQAWLVASGIQQQYWRAVDFINTKESQWCPTRWQGYYGPCLDYYEEAYPGAESDGSKGYGLCQSTPANKMAAAGADWRTNPVTQLKWCQMHADSHHGGWANAYNYWLQNNHW